MELDALKQAIMTLHQRLEQTHALNFDSFRARRADGIRASLRPVVWGHAAQVAVGILLALLVGPFWWNHRDQLNLMVAGALLHVYAVLMIALGARVLFLIQTLDLSAPVLAIQKQLARFRRSYVTTSLVVGLPWFLLWVPLVMVIARVDLVSQVPRSWFVANFGVGIAGIAITLWCLRGLWRSSDPSRVRKLEDTAAGDSVRGAQKFLDEIARFERE